MRSFLSFVVLASVTTSLTTFAATGDMALPTLPSAAPTVTPTAVATPATPVATSGTSMLPSVTPDVRTTSMNAAATPTVASAGSSLGEYKSVSCSSNPSFSVNSCNQCFESSVKVGVRLTGIFDNWTNPTTDALIAYKDEQKNPNLIKFGNSIWTSTPADDTKVWKYSNEAQWISSGTGTRSQFILSPSSKIKFLEADFGAGFTLDKTDKKNGEVVGMLRFPVVYHTLNLQSASEGVATTHYECVAYKLDAPVVAPTGTGAPEVKPTTPADVTKTQTGPETLLLIAAAFFIAFGMMFALRRRV